MSPKSLLPLVVLALIACGDDAVTPRQRCEAESLTLSLETDAVRVGDSLAVQAVLAPECPGATLVWSSSDSSVVLPEAREARSAMLLALSPGSAQVVARVAGEPSLADGWTIQVSDSVPGGPGPAGPQSASAPIRTDGGEYVLTRRPHRGGYIYEGEIPFVYANPRPDTVWVPNCHEALVMTLERRLGSGWEEVWRPITPACLSAPIVLPPGGQYAATLRVNGGTEASRVAPTFPEGSLTGVYRLVWHGPVSAYDPNARPFGPPLPLEERVSNAFTLRVTSQ